MGRFVETFATAILLIIAILFLLQFLSGNSTKWLKSKFVAQ